MAILETALALGEKVAWPDALSRAAIEWLVGRTAGKLRAAGPAAQTQFARDMVRFPIAEHTDAANEQHYEVPAEFFALVLGQQRKYSCCYYDNAQATLDQAEESALALTAEHAGLKDGQRILELGCGWGSLSLWMARNFPNSRVTAVSNSQSQRAAIMERAAAQGSSNLDVVTADMNDFATGDTFDRIVSVEMFEHMANWRGLLERARGWLKPDGKLFIHVFTHRTAPYRFDRNDKTDWIAQHFFTGGVMPSHNLIREFPDLFTVEQDWFWNGTHYQRTADDWLANYDANRAQIEAVLRRVYGDNAKLWLRRWRLFFLATSGLFGHAGGEEWGVSHYRLTPVSQ